LKGGPRELVHSFRHVRTQREGAVDEADRALVRFQVCQHLALELLRFQNFEK
jgi:hypothetical protein